MMFRRYVITKINEQIGCYQGILVTLGTKLLSNKLSDSDQAEAQSIFDELKKRMPIPSLDQETTKMSVSWLKVHSKDFDECVKEMSRTILILKKIGYEVLVLESDRLEGILYEDSIQVLTAAGRNTFRTRSY